jgi:hypothetical protein
MILDGAEVILTHVTDKNLEEEDDEWIRPFLVHLLCLLVNFITDNKKN